MTANAQVLNRLRWMANAILHHDDEGAASISGDPAKLERNVVGLLYALRALIESAPPHGEPALDRGP